ncbi:MAG: glycerate kinase, partial [Anaerotignum sp.]|nr:glycerate kinase [Anaerotignum sp.]
KSAESLGYTPMILTNMLNCEAKDAGKFFASIAKTIQKDNLPLKPPCAIICGGETIVRITGQGKGGRNQELALSAAESISGMDNVVIAAAGSDGTDGPTDAAGGIVDGNTKALLYEKGISIPAILADNNSYYALKEVDSLIMTGPTGTNVNDLYLLLCK